MPHHAFAVPHLLSPVVEKNCAKKKLRLFLCWFRLIRAFWVYWRMYGKNKRPPTAVRGACGGTHLAYGARLCTPWSVYVQNVYGSLDFADSNQLITYNKNHDTMIMCLVCWKVAVAAWSCTPGVPYFLSLVALVTHPHVMYVWYHGFRGGIGASLWSTHTSSASVRSRRGSDQTQSFRSKQIRRPTSHNRCMIIIWSLYTPLAV